MASVRDAQVEAVRTLGEMLRDDGPEFWKSEETGMTVFSANGEILFRLLLSSVVSPTLTDPTADITRDDPDACRKALWEMREIAAAASLQDSPMTDQEALRTLTAIAGWVQAEAPTDGSACGDVVGFVTDVTAGVDIDALDRHQAMELFRQVEDRLARPT
ncbi:hypothetical protein KWG63_14795 [Brevundimonas nasdae]|uniref:DUF6894 domain-containing protein n=1 Tax=Brevundimonas nasdae TaxID=172043 RepID=A0ABX8TJ19_9CAUL|nr:hypothetical protein [Brevundimonas nasdae]QYC10674.1 hypothetical protein KWG56_01240 [Brevundimonas nasdae]QYC13461.1 hypothetical protein KWG63_14795 [Brevundimonas nasdae]